MRILTIGDPHGNLEKIKKIPIKNIDLILITGDLGKADLARKRFFENIKREQKGLLPLENSVSHNKAVYNEIHESTLEILKYLSKYAPVYTLEGNVGISGISEVKKYYERYGIKLISTRDQINKIKNVSIVKNRLRILNNLRVGFLEYFLDDSWVKEFKPKNYQESKNKAKKQTCKAKRILEKFGQNLDILVCHQPPFGILDKVNFKGIPKSWQNKRAGSKIILDYIKNYSPKYVFCGHIHEGKGMKKIGKTKIFNLGAGGYKIVEF